jgi:hypothetical protein
MWMNPVWSSATAMMACSAPEMGEPSRAEAAWSPPPRLLLPPPPLPGTERRPPEVLGPPEEESWDWLDWTVERDSDVKKRFSGALARIGSSDRTSGIPISDGANAVHVTMSDSANEQIGGQLQLLRSGMYSVLVKLTRE